MKKCIIFYTVFAIALGIMLIAIGISGCITFARTLGADTKDYGSIIIVVFYYGLMYFLLLVSVIFIFAGIPYLIRGIKTIFAFSEKDLFKLQVNLKKSKKINIRLLVLIILYDLSTIGSFFKNWNDVWSVIYNILTISITVLAVAVQITNVRALKSLYREPINNYPPS